MSPRGLALLAGAAGLAAGGAGGWAAHRAADGADARRYLLAHPQAIGDVLAELQARDTAAAVRGERAALVTPFAGAWAGNPRGDVTLVMFSDYACGFCRGSLPDIDRLLADDPGLKVVWREIPVLGPDSEAAARVALAAARTGRYLPFHRALFAGGRPDADHLQAAARAAGLDWARLRADAAAAPIGREVDRNLRLAARLRVDGTPTFVVGDRVMGGAVGHDRLAQAIAAARAGA